MAVSLQSARSETARHLKLANRQMWGFNPRGRERAYGRAALWNGGHAVSFTGSAAKAESTGSLSNLLTFPKFR